MSEYAWIYRNVRESTWMVFALHFSIAIPYLNEHEVIFLKRRNLILSMVARSIWLVFCLRRTNFTNKISSLLLALGAKAPVTAGRESWYTCENWYISNTWLQPCNVSRSCTIFAKESDIERTSAWRAGTRAAAILLLGTIKSVCRNSKNFKKSILKYWHIR